MGSQEEQQSKVAEFDKQFNGMIEALGTQVPKSAREYLRDIVFNTLAGDDGLLSEGELQQLGSTLLGVMQRIINYGFDDTNMGYLTQSIEAARQKIADAWTQGANWEDMGSSLGINLSLIENDLDTLDEVNRLLSNNAMTFDEFQAILADSTSLDDFNERLANLKKTLVEPTTTGGAGAGGGEEDSSIISTVKSLGDIAKDAAENISNLKDVRDAMKNGEPISAKDLINIMEIKPELLGLIGDTEAFTKAVNDSVEEQGDRMVTAAQSFIMNSAEIAKNSPFASMLENDTDTLQDYVDSIHTGTDEGKAAMTDFDQWMGTVVFSMLDSMGMLGDVSKDTLSSLMSLMYPDVSADVLSQTWVDAAELVKKGWKDANDSIATFSFGRADNASEKE